PGPTTPPHRLIPYTTLFRSGPDVVGEGVERLAPQQPDERADRRNAGDQRGEEPHDQRQAARGPPRLADLIRLEHRGAEDRRDREDRKSTRLNSSHVKISYAV